MMWSEDFIMYQLRKIMTPTHQENYPPPCTRNLHKNTNPNNTKLKGDTESAREPMPTTRAHTESIKKSNLTENRVARSLETELKAHLRLKWIDEGICPNILSKLLKLDSITLDKIDDVIYDIKKENLVHELSSSHIVDTLADWALNKDAILKDREQRRRVNEERQDARIIKPSALSHQASEEELIAIRNQSGFNFQSRPIEKSREYTKIAVVLPPEFMEEQEKKRKKSLMIDVAHEISPMLELSGAV